MSDIGGIRGPSRYDPSQTEAGIQEGLRDGQKIAYDPQEGQSEVSKAADAAEELTMTGSEKGQQEGARKDKLKSRKAHLAAEQKEVKKAQQADLKQKYTQLLPELSGNKQFDEFPKLVRQMPNPNWEAILEKANVFSDVSHKHAALAFLNDQLGSEGKESEPLAVQVQIAMIKLSDDPELGPQIRAGYNVTAAITEAVETFNSDPEKTLHNYSVNEVRDFYRSMIEGDENKTISDLYRQVYEQGKADGFVDYLNVAIKLSGEDMKSTGPLGPSRSKERLQSNIDTLYQVQTLGNTRKEVITMLERIDNMANVTINVTKS